MSLAANSASLIHRNDSSQRSAAQLLAYRDPGHFDISCVVEPELSQAFGLHVSICDVTQGPTRSWKDCVAPGVVEAALRQGARRVVVASSGNHGRAIAFACRAANLQTAVLVYDRTPTETITSLVELGAEVLRFPDRTAVHAAMDALIADGCFSATLPDRLRDRGSMPGSDGYRRIASVIAANVDRYPIVVVPTCYGDGAASVRRYLVQLGRAPTMCLIRASDAGGSIAASIATDVVTPQVSEMLASGAFDIRVEDRSFCTGLETMKAVVGKPLDCAEGGFPEALTRLAASDPALHRPIVCVLTGGVYTGTPNR